MMDSVKSDIDKIRLQLSTLNTDFRVNAQKQQDDFTAIDYKIEDLRVNSVGLMQFEETLEHQMICVRDLKSL